jgi:hypothetical protein
MAQYSHNFRNRILQFGAEAIIDGEVVVIHEGRTNFSQLQAELAAGRQDRLVFYASIFCGAMVIYASCPRSSASRCCPISSAKTTLGARSFTPNT